MTYSEVPNESSVPIRPELLAIVVAASIFASAPLAAHATTIENNHYSDAVQVVSVGSQINASPSTYSSAISSSMQISASTMATPIGEMEDGSKVSAGTSFGQWFFLIYVVVSLLAGGKEMLSRAQKQFDKDS